MKRSGLGGWAWVALLCVGVVSLVAWRWSREGEMPVPNVAGSAVSGVQAEAAAPVAGDGASAGATPAGDLPLLTATDAMHLYKEGFEEGSETDIASYVSAYLRPGQSFAEYIADLHGRIARGDTAAMVKMAQVLGECWSIHSRAEDIAAHKLTLEGEYQPDYAQIARLCNSTLALPDNEGDVENQRSELIIEAARRGDEAAILTQIRNRPRWLALDPASERAQAWVNEAIGRLEVLASKGNLKAVKELGDLYTGSSYVSKNYPKAATYYRQVLNSAPVSTGEAMVRSMIPGPDMGRY